MIAAPAAAYQLGVLDPDVHFAGGQASSVPTILLTGGGRPAGLLWFLALEVRTTFHSERHRASIRRFTWAATSAGVLLMISTILLVGAALAASMSAGLRIGFQVAFVLLLLQAVWSGWIAAPA